jgi:tetratricopeptide (TPR) repeat protein
MSLLDLRKHRRALSQGVCCFVLAACVAVSAPAQTPKGFEAAAAAYASGNLPETERLARQALSRHPDDLFGMNLLAVALDGQKKYSEAEAVYLRALRQGRNSTLLNNLANHYLAAGQRDKARKFYLETLRLDPRHVNAHYQLASLLLEEQKPLDALEHLRALPKEEQQKPAVVILRGEALFKAGRPEDARKTLDPLEAAKDKDLATAFSLGVMYFRLKLYPQAVAAFEAALQQSPGDFDILYNLGLAYTQAGQKERALDVLQQAVRINSHSADALYHLAVLMGELGRNEPATELLIRAREIEPERPELSLLLARECAKQQFWLDASEAYEAYLRLKPGDEDVRRELTLVYGRLQYFEQALEQMNRYVAARPKDADGFHLRGLIEWHLKRAEPAAADFNRALELNPKKAESWSRLGEIARQKNDLNEAQRCFHRALDIQPTEVNALSGLGQTLNTEGKFREAIPFLQKAIEVRVEAPAPHYQLAMAYRRLGDQARARVEMEKFQQLQKTPEEKKFLRTGLVAYMREGMGLSDAERRSRELEYLERATAIKSGDTRILARLADAYLSANKKTQAEETIQKWLAADQSGVAALKVGQLFAQHGDYAAAIEYFHQAADHEASRYAAVMGLADAEFRLGRPESALQTLQGLSPSPEDADYFLLRAAILDKLQRFEDALAAYQQAIRVQPKQETPYFELGLFFVRHQAFDAAQEDFRASQQVLPHSLRLALAEAIVLNLAGKRAESQEKLQDIEKHWPEQDLPYIVAGISAYTAYRFEDARREFEKAESLESANPLTYYYLALINSTSNPEDRMESLHWAEMAVAGDPTFAQAQALMGRLYKELGRNQEARKCLEEAVRLQPDLSDAHYLLSRVYRDLGDTARAEAEIRESERWHREVSQVTPEKENILRLLVRVDSTPR